MKDSSNKVELLLPAQNIKSIKIIKDYADAIYFGVDVFNMRMNAGNIPLEKLEEAVSLIHSYGVKAYLTTNVIIYENESEYMHTLLENAKTAGVDAVIVHDLSVIKKAKELGLPFHVSTQMSISNSEAALVMEEMGAERIILARELTLHQINAIVKKMTHSGIEVFIHGAQCTSISGRCYFSQQIYNDMAPNKEVSANRGHCLQPCRTSWDVLLTHPNGEQIEYKDGFFLNSKDLCMIGHIPEIIETGVVSLKIEGRMRDSNYLEVVGRCYREAIDAHYEGTYTEEKVNNWQKQLSAVYNRGFSTGYFYGTPDVQAISGDQSGNLATARRVQVGEVSMYFRNQQVAKVKLYQHTLKIGDYIVIEGGGDGRFLKQKLANLRVKNKEVTQTPPVPKGTGEEGDPNWLNVSFKVDSPVYPGNKVYLFVER